MHTDQSEDVTGAVIGSAIEVSRVLGAGFLEKVYGVFLLPAVYGPSAGDPN
jgi:hypothetical protein